MTTFKVIPIYAPINPSVVETTFDFIKCIIQILHSVCRIAEVLISLQQVGNVKYTGWILKVPCTKKPEIIPALQKKAKTMESELDEWRELVKCARQEFYELNYYTTLQLLSLRKELGSVRLANKAAVSPNTLTLLESISSMVTSDIVCEILKNLSDTQTKQSNCSLSEDQTYSSHDISSVSLNEELLGLTDTHTTNSVQDIVYDQVKLSESELSEEEMAIMAYVTGRIMCSKELVLKAFEICPNREKMDMYDFENWCNENIDEYKFKEDSENEDSSEDDEETSSESSDLHFTYSIGKCIFKIRHVHNLWLSTLYLDNNEDSTSPWIEGEVAGIIEIEEAFREAVDEDHSVVKDLVLAGYSLEQSIDAVENYGTLDAALEYLGTIYLDEEETDLFSNYQPQLSHEDSQPNDSIIWSVAYP